mmetsp:Transcript_104206/g.252927  ORF Transcript_104206/g.252927 Transcript_104206/m.252927 type:complete len:483 (-) Transcript_104206:616-2064(-)
MDILHHGELGVVRGLFRVRRGEDGGPSVEGADDAGLRDTHGLLLHGLMQNGPRVVVHLVKLVDAADSPIRQHQRAALEHQLLGDGVFVDGGGKAHGAAALAGGVDASGRQLVGVLQQLRLCRGRISAKKRVDLWPAPALAALRQGLRRAPEQLAEQAPLHLVLLVDGWREGLHKLLRNGEGPIIIPLCRHFTDGPVPLDVLLCARLWVQVLLLCELRWSLLRGEHGLNVLSRGLHTALSLRGDGDGIDVRAVDGAAHLLVAHGPHRCRTVDARDLDAVAWPDRVHKVVEDADRHVLRRLALRHELGRLLELQDLAVGELALVVDDLEGVAGAAAVAARGLLDGPVAEGDLNLVLAVLSRAPEEPGHHVGHEVGAPDDDALDADEALDVRGVHEAHDLAVLLHQRVNLHLAGAQVLRLRPKLAHGDIPQLAVKDGDDLRREAHEVIVQALAVVEDVGGVDGELDALLLLDGLLPAPLQLLQVV